MPEAIVELRQVWSPLSSPPGGHSLLSVVACREARQYVISDGRGEKGDL